MSYDICGYVQKREKYGWKNVPLYKSKSKDNYELVELCMNSEAAKYIWDKGYAVTEEEKKRFHDEMFPGDDPYDSEDPFFHVKAISLAALKYYAVTFNPDDNDYEGAGEEDWIKRGLQIMVNRIETALDLADEYYFSLDNVRFIYYESF